MPSKTKLKNAAIAAKSAALPKISKELIEEFVTGPINGETVNVASMAFKKGLIERSMAAELGHHLSHPAGASLLVLWRSKKYCLANSLRFQTPCFWWSREFEPPMDCCCTCCAWRYALQFQNDSKLQAQGR